MPEDKSRPTQGDQLLSRARQLLNQADNPRIQQLAPELPLQAETVKGPVTIAIAGAYSSGKSTLLKALTGHGDIAIGAGITTEEIQRLPWEGCTLIDTPGIHTEIRPEHDAAAYNALTAADLLVFVITNELFDAENIEHFQRLTQARDKGAETLLVINKMTRHYLGNSPEARAVIKEDLAKILPLAQLSNAAFVDARDAVAAAAEAQPERQEFLRRRSNFGDCADKIRNFIQEKGAAAQQTTPLYQIQQILQQAKDLTNPELDQQLLQTEGRLRQHQEILAQGIDSWTIAAENFSAQAQEEMHKLQSKALDIHMEKDRLAPEDEAEFAAESEAIAHRMHDHILESFADHTQRLEAEIKDLWDVEHIRQALEGLSGHFQAQGNGLALSAAARPLSSLFRIAAHETGDLSSLSGVSGSLMHEGVLAAGNFFGKNFHPWEAIKLARGLGTAAAVAGPILSIAFQVWEDHKEIQKQKEMRKQRQVISKTFTEAARELQKHATAEIQALKQAWNQNSLNPTLDSIAEVTAAREGHQSWQTQFNQLETELQQLIHAMHRAEKGAV